jgi:hypothetical protein
LGVVDAFGILAVPDSMARYFKGFADCIEMEANDSRRESD